MGDLLQPWHLIVLAIVAFVLFGAKRLPELGKGLGEGLKGSRKASRESATRLHQTPTRRTLRPRRRLQPRPSRSRAKANAHERRPYAPVLRLAKNQKACGILCRRPFLLMRCLKR